MNLGGLPLGPPRRRRSCRRRGAGRRRRSTTSCRFAPPVDARSTRSSAARVSSSPATRTRPSPQRYQALVERVRAAEQARPAGADGPRRSGGALLRQAARLQGRVRSRAALRRGGFRSRARTAVRRRLQAQVPPRAAAASPARDPKTGHLLKQEFGRWMLPAFRVLAKLKFLRGTALDLVRPHRRAQAGARADRANTRRWSTSCCRALARQSRAGGEARRRPRRHPRLRPRQGRQLDKAKRKEAELLAQWRNPAALKAAAE